MDFIGSLAEAAFSKRSLEMFLYTDFYATRYRLLDQSPAAVNRTVFGMIFTAACRLAGRKHQMMKLGCVGPEEMAQGDLIDLRLLARWVGIEYSDDKTVNHDRMMELYPQVQERLLCLLRGNGLGESVVTDELKAAVVKESCKRNGSRRLPFEPYASNRVCRLNVQVEKAALIPSAPVAPNRDESDKLLSLSSRLKVLETERESTRSAHEAEVFRLNAEINRLKDSSDTQPLRDLNAKLGTKIRSLMAALDTRDGPGHTTVVVDTTTWDDLELHAQLVGGIVLTTRALKGVRRSIFANKPFVYDVLRFLGQTYVPMLNGDGQARGRYQSMKDLLKIEVGPVGVAFEAAPTKEEYRVAHRGQRYTLDWHVQGSSSRDPTKGFRLYFCEIEEDGRKAVLVGSMPEHLENTWS